MSTVDDIKGRLDIVETVSGYVSLQKSGRNFKAPCPFHTEKTPSFLVNPERQSWHCFGACATGGDLFSFVMRKEGLDFSGALALLAQKAGVTLERQSQAERGDVLYRINQAASRFYQDVLGSAQGQRGSRYLDERGVNFEARSKFELGLSPDRRDELKSHLLQRGFSVDQAAEAGLLHRADDGNTWDFFRGRLMFPIHDRTGRITGFGARALDDSTPKYLNTSKTAIFDKRSMLYGLHLASESIRTQNTGVVVEGYMDAIAAHQHGYANVVASMGTALTEQQVSKLKSLASNFVLALDPDAAGQEATLRSLETSWRIFEGQVVDGRRRSVGVLYQREPLTLKIAALPAGRDPDTLIRQDTREWERLTEEAVPFMDFCISAIASRFDLGTPRGKAQAAEALTPMIMSADFLEQDQYLRKLAEVLDVKAESLRASIGAKIRSGATRNLRGPAPEITISPLAGKPEDSLDDYTLALLLTRPELKQHVGEPDGEYFHNSEDREVFTRWFRCTTIDDLRDSLDESLHERLTHLLQKQLGPTDLRASEAALEQCLQRMEQRHLREVQEGLLASEDASTPPPREMEGEITGVNARIRELSS